MDERKIDSLANLLNPILNQSSGKFEITIAHHVDLYLDIFLGALRENNGNPVPYDSFAEQLWVKLAKDRPLYAKTLNDFTTVWTAWVHLYRHLQNQHLIQ
jgi:hypothetical protein